MTKKPTAKLSMEGGSHLADSNPDVYNRYQIRRALESAALPKNDGLTMPLAEYSRRVAEEMAFSLRYNTSGFDGKSCMDQIMADEEALLGYTKPESAMTIETRTAQHRITERYVAAVSLASELHATQLRKGTAVPYLSHLLSVSALTLEYGGNEDEAIAGLLHDAVEDAGGRPTLERIRAQFGGAVADIVEGCTDSETVPKPPWRERKERYIAHLKSASPSIRLVSNCDKLHNARCILSDVRVIGPALWQRFNASPQEVLWYYRSLHTGFAAHGVTPLTDELRRLVDEIAKHIPN